MKKLVVLFAVVLTTLNVVAQSERESMSLKMIRDIGEELVADFEYEAQKTGLHFSQISNLTQEVQDEFYSRFAEYYLYNLIASSVHIDLRVSEKIKIVERDLQDTLGQNFVEIFSQTDRDRILKDLSRRTSGVNERYTAHSVLEFARDEILKYSLAEEEKRNKK